MRTIVALAMTLTLISILALCPVVFCPLMASEAGSGSCCHKPPSHSAPCSQESVPDCPYSILAKSKTNAGATHATWVGVALRPEHGATLVSCTETVSTPCRLVDAGDLFLRNRILLI